MKTKDQIVEELIGVIGEIQKHSDYDFDHLSEGMTEKNLITSVLGDEADAYELIGFIRGAYGFWKQGFTPYNCIRDVADEIVTHLSMNERS